MSHWDEPEEIVRYHRLAYTDLSKGLAEPEPLVSERAILIYPRSRTGTKNLSNRDIPNNVPNTT